MIRHYEGKEVMNDDVIITEYIDLGGREYRLAKWFCGGINEEGEENLEGSLFCDITVYEVANGNEEVFKKIADEFGGEIEEELIMVCAPAYRYTVTVRNESSYDDTEEMYEEIIKIIEEIG